MHHQDQRIPGARAIPESAIPEPAGPSQPPATTRTKGGVLTATRGKRNGALDGLRGLAVTAVMAYHVVPDPFTGGWLGVDIFMVLSGFLICSMLLRERVRTKSIDYKRFLIRRARRLLPGLALMLIAILAAAMVWESAGRRKHVAIDVLSSALQVSNWRLILADESYFAKVSVPSPIRHTWSLGVQEQFYFIFPLLLLALMAWLKSWRALIIIFTTLAAISTWRMIDLYIPGTDPSRVYFGTDTRLSELLIGVVGAIILFQRNQIAARENTRGPRTWSRATEQLIGWAGLASLLLIIYWMFTVNEFSPWLFQGGLIFISVITMVIITAATSPVPNVMTRLLATKPLMKTGDMSYSLYIWHWPIIVYLAPALPASSELTRQILAVVLTIAVSWTSYTFIENPIHKHGLKGFRANRPRVGQGLAVATVPVIVSMSLVLAFTPGFASGSNLVLRLPADPNYGSTPEDLSADTPIHDVVLVGASTVVGLNQRGEPEMTPDIHLRTGASLGCTPYARDELLTEDRPRQEGSECSGYREQWVESIARSNGPTAILMVMTRLFTDFAVDGRRVSPKSTEWEGIVHGILDEFDQRSRGNGATHVAIINMPCHERAYFGGDDTVARSNDFEMTQYLNSVIDEWAAASGASVYDMYGLLCPGDSYFDHINGLPLYDDGLHFTEQAAPIIWQWIAHELREDSRRNAGANA